MSETDEAVGRCYTKARRHRNVIGQWDGHRLWGGPYSVPQFVTMAAVLGLMVLARGLWAHLGLFNIVPLLVVPYASSFLVRVLHIDGRNPFAAAASAAGLAFTGSRGRLGGRVLRARRPQLLSGAATLACRAPAPCAARPAERAAAVPGVRPATSASAVYALLQARAGRTTDA